MNDGAQFFLSTDFSKVNMKLRFINTTGLDHN